MQPLSSIDSSYTSRERVARAKGDHRIAVVIPAFNEDSSILRVLEDIPTGLVDEIVVVDNRSTDQTASIARAAGATVLFEPRQGYGSACLTGVAYVLAREYDIVVFIDADYSDHPEEMTLLVEKIALEGFEMVIGSRSAGALEPGAMAAHARFGNWLATSLIRLLWGVRFSDLGPFRAITAEALRRIAMRDTNYGWTVEMQIKAARMKLRCTEVPVSYRKRIGISKITGSISGSVKAGYKILYTIARYGLLRR
ncbi:MAG: glycosyltransferase family 2 protein [Bacteroidetes bacterium]|nr:glycosyltransferase family 2 protein [Bacteroidota bacterium]